MDFMSGGELFSHLASCKKFSEKRAKYYAAQLLCALEDLHKMNIIYRDLKPENIMMDENGNIRLTDFGLSKLGVDEKSKTYTLAGTPEYIAPEILSNAGHD